METPEKPKTEPASEHPDNLKAVTGIHINAGLLSGLGSRKTEDVISDLQVQKLEKELKLLDIEITNKYKSSPKGFLTHIKEFLPSIIAIVTITTGALSIYTYFDNKKREYETKLNSDIIDYVKELVGGDGQNKGNAIYMLSYYQNDAVGVLLHTLEQSDNEYITSNIIRSMRLINKTEKLDRKRFISLIIKNADEFYDFGRTRDLSDFTEKFQGLENYLQLIKELDLVKDTGVNNMVTRWRHGINESYQARKMEASNFNDLNKKFNALYEK